ncbi:hypothetical protein JCM16303_005291 [Sporobolomyces ruberrimus]
MRSEEAFKAFRFLDRHAALYEKDDQTAYHDRRAKLCELVLKASSGVDPAEHKRRYENINEIDSAYPKNPGWHFFDKAEWAKIDKAKKEFEDGSIKLEDLHLQSPLQGRTRLLEEYKTDVKRYFRTDTAAITSWNQLFHYFQEDESNLVDVKKWNRIRTVLNYALDPSKSMRPGRTPVTPAAVLEKLGIKVPATLLDKPAHPSTSAPIHEHKASQGPESPGSTHKQGGQEGPVSASNSYEHVLHQAEQHAVDDREHQSTTTHHHNPTSRSPSPAASSQPRHSSRGHRAVARIHKAFKPRQRSHSQHTPRDHRHSR